LYVKHVQIEIDVRGEPTGAFGKNNQPRPEDVVLGKSPSEGT
jgi:hypothetical protein